MLVLLISLPFSLGDDAMSGTAPYILYSLFLTSIGIVIGVSLTWLNDPSRLLQAQSRKILLRPPCCQPMSPPSSSPQGQWIDVAEGTGRVMRLHGLQGKPGADPDGARRTNRESTRRHEQEWSYQREGSAQ